MAPYPRTPACMDRTGSRRSEDTVSSCLGAATVSTNMWEMPCKWWLNGKIIELNVGFPSKPCLIRRGYQRWNSHVWLDIPRYIWYMQASWMLLLLINVCFGCIALAVWKSNLVCWHFFCFLLKPAFNSGISQLAMFDDTKGYCSVLFYLLSFEIRENFGWLVMLKGRFDCFCWIHAVRPFELQFCPKNNPVFWDLPWNHGARLSAFLCES